MIKLCINKINYNVKDINSCNEITEYHLNNVIGIILLHLINFYTFISDYGKICHIK